MRQSSTLRYTVLRKLIATYCIQLNVTDEYMEDFFTCMDYSDKIHKNELLTTGDTLKLSKYLETLQSNKYNPDENKNSSTDSNLRNDVLNECNFIDNNKVEKEKSLPSGTVSDTNSNTISVNIEIRDKENNKRKRYILLSGRKIRWTQEEKETALHAFSEYMEELKLPSSKDIELIKKKYTSLDKRTCPQIKTWLIINRNLYDNNNCTKFNARSVLRNTYQYVRNVAKKFNFPFSCVNYILMTH